MNMKKIGMTIVMLAAAMEVRVALGGPLDPECTPGKAAKGAAERATVGVGNRCKPGEAVTDTTKRALGVEDKGPIEKHRDNDNDKDGGLLKNNKEK